MKMPRQIVVFTIEALRYGIPLAAVDRVVRMVEITPLPAGPEFIHGVINVQGEIMPVLNLRRRFGLPEQPLELSDQLIITRFAGRCYALVADTVSEVHLFQVREVAEAAAILPGLPFLSGVAKLPDGMILIHDPEKLLSPRELLKVDKAVKQEQAWRSP